MLVRYISTGVLGVMGPSGADMVDSVHILCVCVGGGWCVCLHMYIHIIHSPGKIMLLQSDHSCIHYDIDYTHNVVLHCVPYGIPGLSYLVYIYVHVHIQTSIPPPHTHT